MSPKVRVRYFDPATGEPRKIKLEPKRAKKRMEDQGKLSASLARRAKKRSRGARNPSSSTGWRTRASTARAKAVGCAGCTITRNLRNGATEYKGHSIRFKDPRHASR